MALRCGQLRQRLLSGFCNPSLGRQSGSPTIGFTVMAEESAMTGMLPLPSPAWLDRMIVTVETSLTSLLASIDLRAQMGRDVASWRNMLASQERHLPLLYRSRGLL